MTAVLPYCPGCGRKVEPDWRFCGACSTPLGDRITASGPSTPVPAGFGQRLASFVLDALVLAVLTSLITAVLSIPYWELSPPDIVSTDPAYALDSFIGFLTTGLPVVITPLVYLVLMGARPRGQTLGQRAVGIRVVGPDGRPPGLVRAAWRLVARGLSLLPAGLGYYEMRWHPHSRTWHDRMSGTSVIVGRPPATVRRPGRVMLPVSLAVSVATLLSALIVLDNRLHDVERVDLDALAVGDCIVDPGFGFGFDWVRRLPCELEHGGEVVHTYAIAAPRGAPFDEDRTYDSALERCETALAEYAGADVEDLDHYADPLVPTPEDWDAGQRLVVCVAWSDWETPGSVRSAGRPGPPAFI